MTSIIAQIGRQQSLQNNLQSFEATCRSLQEWETNPAAIKVDAPKPIVNY